MISTTDAAQLLKVDTGRVRRLAARWGIGTKLGPRAWMFTDADLESLRDHLPGVPGRPRLCPIAQSDPTLPPIGAIISDGELIQCHVCGRWYGALVTHIRAHNLNAASYKDRFGLARGTSLLGPLAAERRRHATIERNQFARMRPYVTPHARPPGSPNRLESNIRFSAENERRKREST